MVPFDNCFNFFKQEMYPFEIIFHPQKHFVITKHSKLSTNVFLSIHPKNIYGYKRKKFIIKQRMIRLKRWIRQIKYSLSIDLGIVFHEWYFSWFIFDCERSNKWPNPFTTFIGCIILIIINTLSSNNGREQNNISPLPRNDIITMYFSFKILLRIYW